LFRLIFIDLQNVGVIYAAFCIKRFSEKWDVMVWSEFIWRGTR